MLGSPRAVAFANLYSSRTDERRVVFLHTTVDHGNHFQQILAWTLKSRWQKQDQLLREVTASFRSEK
jgi:hypothetical protein